MTSPARSHLARTSPAIYLHAYVLLAHARMIPTTSAHVRVSRRDRIRMTKGAEPAGGERSKVKDQRPPPDPIKGQVQCSRVPVRGGERQRWSSELVVGAQRSLESGGGWSPVQGCWSLERSGVWSPVEVGVQCRAVGRVAAGERSPAGPETVRATLRSERALKRASTPKEQGPFAPLKRRRPGLID